MLERRGWMGEPAGVRPSLMADASDGREFLMLAKSVSINFNRPSGRGLRLSTSLQPAEKDIDCNYLNATNLHLLK